MTDPLLHDIKPDNNSGAEISDIVIVSFGELSGIAGVYSFGGSGSGVIACRVLFIHPGCGITIRQLSADGGDAGPLMNVDGGEKGTLVFFAPRPDSTAEIRVDGGIYSAAGLLYIDFLTPAPFTASGMIYTQSLQRRPDLISYTGLIESLLFRYYTEGETEEGLKGCREAAAAFVNYAPASAGVPRVTDERLIRSMRSIRTALRDITRAEAARAGGVSSVYIGELFEKNLGITIGRYIREYRLCAAQMLTRHGMTVDEAAKTVGYNGGSSLARAKRRFRGDETPDVPDDLGAGLE